ncbi:571_t:CDS:2, partial [Entrophospora sp. SA101]
VHHFQTILLKAVPELPAVPFDNLHINKNVHNLKGIDAELIVENVQLVNLVERSLHSTGDYIEALENIFNVPELKAYLEQ